MADNIDIGVNCSFPNLTNLYLAPNSDLSKTLYGDILNVSCPPGYEFRSDLQVGKNSITCLANSSWSAILMNDVCKRMPRSQ